MAAAAFLWLVERKLLNALLLFGQWSFPCWGPLLACAVLAIIFAAGRQPPAPGARHTARRELCCSSRRQPDTSHENRAGG
ncbi:hypothetical protein [Ornithinicoccus halotolerans]|uniref:hypothetical protein n=1 Tax=Ornithinicoccus halotolerans TaxID=1748220 RepID=UPI001294C092|nr:hypothetical protein [Ornithinicoccus halotolerans]